MKAPGFAGGWLLDILSKSEKIILTPNTLTETSNLAAHISEPARSHIFLMFKDILADPRLTEIFVESHLAMARPEFTRLGLTDSVLLHIGSEPTMLLTADLHLYLAAAKCGRNACNFNHLRDL